MIHPTGIFERQILLLVVINLQMTHLTAHNGYSWPTQVRHPVGSFDPFLPVFPTSLLLLEEEDPVGYLRYLGFCRDRKTYLALLTDL